MARWLVTVDASVDPVSLRRRLTDLAIVAAVADEAIPLGDDERVVSVESEEDLIVRLEGEPMVRSVYPDSDVVPYGVTGSGPFL